MKGPCKDCKLRHIGCHSTCRVYIDFYAQRRIDNAENNERKNRESDLIHARDSAHKAQARYLGVKFH